MRIRQNADLHLEAYVRNFLLNKWDNPIQPSCLQYCYRRLWGAGPRLTESNVCVCVCVTFVDMISLAEGTEEQFFLRGPRFLLQGNIKWFKC